MHIRLTKGAFAFRGWEVRPLGCVKGFLQGVLGRSGRRCSQQTDRELHFKTIHLSKWPFIPGNCAVEAFVGVCWAKSGAGLRCFDD